MHEGVSFYVGMTKTGKTYLALDHLREAIIENGNPGLIVKMVNTSTLEGLPCEKSLDDVLAKLYGNPRTNAVYKPKSEDETEALMRAISADDTGGVNVLVDEIYWVPCNGRKIATEFSKALRGWRQHKLGNNVFFLTSQRPGDLHGDGYTARTALYVFRPAEGSDVDRLQKDFGLERERMLALKQREFILVRNEITP